MSTVYVFTDYGGPERQQLIDRPPPCRARGTRHRNPSRRCEPGGLEDTGRTPGPSPEPAAKLPVWSLRLASLIAARLLALSYRMLE